MKRLTDVFAISAVICLTAFAGISCNRNVFDIDKYKELAKTKSPVDTVDANHTWKLYSENTVIIDPSGAADAKKLQVLTADPAASAGATLLAQTIVDGSERFSMQVCVPANISTLYYALVDGDGGYTVVRASASQRDISFASPLYQGQKPSYTPKPHYFAFCYEQELPEFGDYDYNDVVMHIALEQTGAKEMQFHVKVAAVGASEQLAGLIRLPGYKYDDVDTVFTVGDKSFNVNMHGENIKRQNVYVETEKQMNALLLEGRQDEAILNLFADAHWAVGEVRNTEYDGALFVRKKYNVGYGATTTTAELQPREITFVMRFKDGEQLRYLTLEDIDPFVMRIYGNNRREIHTYTYRAVDALWENKFVDIQNLPWALVVPTGDFYHPLEGVNIGFRMKTEYTNNGEVLWGAYAVSGHSFGEWSVNRNKATDWYENQYATQSMVYVW